MTSAGIHDAGRTTCPGCGGESLRAFFETASVPVHCNILYPDAAAATAAPRGDIVLAFCRDCGLIFNRVFDPALTAYSESYENSLYFSPAFQEYAEWLTDHLVEAFDLHDKDLVEIGCGSAEFLNGLCERGGNRGYGFDPSAPPSRFPSVTIVPEFYGPEHAGQAADAVFSRHVLEHVAEPATLLADIRAAIAARPDTRVYCEVPNGAFILRDLSVWDVIYEHPLYFTTESLNHLFATAEFTVTDTYTAFHDQFLAVEAIPVAGPVPSSDLAPLSTLVDRFGEAHTDKVARWADRCARWQETGTRVALWGAGSKGVTFLNMVPGADRIQSVVDINPRKHGKHVPGTGQPVVGPEDLVDSPPDVVLVMNPIYRDEIAAQLAEIGIAAAVEVI
ncbi:MAG: methyltransferase domain-containing protein [Acidimicrobiia bacterium]|nr:methyltransferase domain-containing protein [Acidimicrobiia bacterium]